MGTSKRTRMTKGNTDKTMNMENVVTEVCGRGNQRCKGKRKIEREEGKEA